MTAESLRAALSALPECELRRCGLRALDLFSDPDPLPARLRDIDTAAFRAFGPRDVPADVLERDYEGALALVDGVGEMQARLRRALFASFGLRCIVGAIGEPYDERSPRYVAATARPTGNPDLDWHVADTASCGYEWDGQPAVLMPARVDVYRYDAALTDDDDAGSALASGGGPVVADKGASEVIDDPAREAGDVTPPAVAAEDGAVVTVDRPPAGAPPVLTITLPDGTRHCYHGPMHVRIGEGAP